MAPARIDPQAWREHALRNGLQSLLLLVVMAGFLALLGWLLWGSAGVVVLLVGGLAALLLQPAISPWLVMRLYGASPLDLRQLPALGSALAAVAGRAGLPALPQLHYLPSRTLNAFTVGTPERAAIAVTDGLLRALSLRELVAVLAHEVAHIRNRDLWVMGLADLCSRMTNLLSLLGQFLLLLNLPLLLFNAATINWLAIGLLILAPTLSALAQLALARTREFDADLNAVRLTGDPDGLALALEKLERAQGGGWERLLFPGRREPVPSLLRTHPETGERIARILELKPRLEPWPGTLDDDLGHDLRALRGRRPVHRPRWHINGLWY
jgi:heat shock protein HtpX